MTFDPSQLSSVKKFEKNYSARATIPYFYFKVIEWDVNGSSHNLMWVNITRDKFSIGYVISIAVAGLFHQPNAHPLLIATCIFYHQ